jgi:hypothetical protein
MITASKDYSYLGKTANSHKPPIGHSSKKNFTLAKQAGSYMLLYICQLYAFVYVLQTPSIVFYI